MAVSVFEWRGELVAGKTQLNSTLRHVTGPARAAWWRDQVKDQTARLEVVSGAQDVGQRQDVRVGRRSPGLDCLLVD